MQTVRLDLVAQLYKVVQLPPHIAGNGRSDAPGAGSRVRLDHDIGSALLSGKGKKVIKAGVEQPIHKVEADPHFCHLGVSRVD